MILVIGNKNCSRCEMTKTILNNKGIDFTYKLIEEISSEDRNKYTALATEKGLLSMPLIIRDENIITLQEV